jgi:chromatin segregation and condensation protein Rec8/ScpA/Scc1 (kleisin family)
MDVIRFSDLISGKKDAVGIFLALLHLDSQKKINMWQKELFGDIFIALN